MNPSPKVPGHDRAERCRYCGRERTGSAMERLETPFCGSCLRERRALGALTYPAAGWIREGDYLIPIRGDGTRR